MLEQSYHRRTASESQSVTLTLCASTFAGLFVDVAPASRPRAGAKPVRVTLKDSLCCFDRTHLSGPAWTSVKIASTRREVLFLHFKRTRGGRSHDSEIKIRQVPSLF